MIRLIGRLALALLGLFVLARAAAAQPAYEPAQAPDGRVYAERSGYVYGYETGSRSVSFDSRSYQSDRYGERREQSSGGYETGYEAEYGSAEAYRSDAVRDGYPPETCDWRRPRDPRDPYACPPGWGEVTLNDSFFAGGGGVGDVYGYGYGGGGGGGFVYAGAGAGAGAFAYASASARVSIRGGGKGGHRPGKRGCGCRH